MTDLHSCFYEGIIRHRRFRPKPHMFSYRLKLCYLDLDELPHLFDSAWLWSAKAPAIARFRRKDYFDGKTTCLKTAILDFVRQQTGLVCDGPVRLLTHLRYFGYGFNPISTYYCFDHNEKLQAIVTEINNTPWGEKHCYAFDCATTSPEGKTWRFDFDKNFHVSPFMPMDIRYRWYFALPGEQLKMHLSNWREGSALFDATLVLKKCPFNGKNRASVLIQYPLQTVKVITAIYWQAAKLWLKRTPFYTHPKKLEDNHGFK